MTPSPRTQTLNITSARAQLTRLAKQVFMGDKRVIIEKSGIPVAALISARDAERLAKYEAEREEDFAFLEQLRERFAAVPVEEHEREVARAVAEVREDRRARGGSDGAEQAASEADA